jgi:anti-anti-sigma factor
MDGLGTEDPSQMTFQIAARDPSTAIVTVTGELDLGSVERLAEAVTPIMETKPDRLVVDLKGLRFADSSAIALWVRWAAVVREIELRDASPLLRRVVESMGLSETLHLKP